VTDEAGKSRKSCIDGVGRLLQVFEDPSNLNYETDYTYDALDNLLTVNQKGNDPNSAHWRPRTFTYDSLSRLLTANNPESGTINYAYDPIGNLISKQAPLPNQTGASTVTTAYVYDALNRLTKKSYTDGLTPQVQFAYDNNTITTGCPSDSPPGQTDLYPVGRRTSMCDASGGTTWIHDKMGRIQSERRSISGVHGDYDTDTFNLDGSIASLTALGYGIGYTYNGAGRVTQVQNFADPVNYVMSAKYAPFGGLTTASLGAKPITITDAYNDRMQPLLISASATASIISLCYDFHLSVAVTSGPCSFSAYSSGDNGNVFQIANKRDDNRTQNFWYDSLNRIQQAYTNGTNWGETYGSPASAPGVAPTTPGIDAWGNLTNRSGVTGKAIYESMSTSAGTNNQLSGFGYDAAGNMTSNGGATYTYDAENRLIATAGISYLYDGDGKRVEKCTAGTTAGTCATNATGTMYWTGTGSDPLAETDLSGNVVENYIFLNGTRIARRDASTKAVHYYFSDHLGTHSLITDANGDMPPQEESDYYPYGGEIPISGSDANHYKFTGKERDTESGLDEFGARYYGSSLGRFMTPDWASKPEAVPYSSLSDPQTLNLYGYMRNNPLGGTDKDGHCGGLTCPNVTVTATPATQPAPVHTTTVTDTQGNQHTVTGPNADIHFVVSTNGTPAAGVKVTETNQSTTQAGTQTVKSESIEGKTTSNSSGGYKDTVGAGLPPSTATPEAAAKAYNSTAVTITDKQTQTLTLPNGCTCTATSTRTVTNVAPGGGISPNGYTLTTTQPVVSTPQPPKQPDK
jgi:RHS repeat-associated protein